MSSIPRVVERFPQFVDLSFRNKPGVLAYRIAGSNTLDGAYAGATTMFEVTQGTVFRSPGIRARRVGLLQESTRGLTRAIYNPEDYVGGALPHDNQMAFLRVQEQNTAGVWRPAGPIMVLPPMTFFSVASPGIPLVGTAPNVAGTVTGVPGPNTMHIVLPKAFHVVTIRNLDGGNSLFFSNDEGAPMMEIPSNTESMYIEAGVDPSLYLRGQGGTVSFVAYLSMMSGQE